MQRILAIRFFVAVIGLVVLLMLCGLGRHALAGRQNKTSSSSLTVQVRHLFGNAPLRMDDVSLIIGAGDDLSVSRLAYFVSDITLIRSDGAHIVLTGDPAYLNPAENRTAFTLSGVPQGSYRRMIFHIGLDSTINHADPSRYPAGHPLNPQVDHLHWGWQGGYVFLAIEGGYTRRDGRLGGYSYHIATDANLMTVTLNGDLSIGGDTQTTLDFDLAKVFAGVSPRSGNGSESTHSAPGDRLAKQLKGAIEHAFTLESCKPATAPVSATANPVPIAVPKGAHSYNFVVPEGFPQPALPADNPLSVEGIALGKRLFFDARLSGNDRQTCASCHRPEFSFSDQGHAHSVGIDGLQGTRRTMPLFNLAWSDPYAWDGRRARLRDQALAPITNTREMHASLVNVVKKLKADRAYPGLFTHAFGSPGITAERIGLAMEQYMLTLVSADSRFDRALRGKEKLNDQEKRGLMLFLTEYDPARGRIGADCFHCHGGNLFSDYRYTNNGLDAKFQDRGRELVTGRNADKGKFKTPSLRNVAATGPYMHDGRFKTLEAVVDHYTTGVHRTETLDPNIAKHPDSGMALTSADKKALVAFLKTLTDYRCLIPPPSKGGG